MTDIKEVVITEQEMPEEDFRELTLEEFDALTDEQKAAYYKKLEDRKTTGIIYPTN